MPMPSLCGSGEATRERFSLLIPSWHAVLSDPGASNIEMFQSFDADITFAG
jgi:hypothetical protein